MKNWKSILGWTGIILLGLINGVLEDLLFISILVPNMPPSWDLTGDLFFSFTVPLAQLLALCISGSLAWFLCGLRQPARLITFWACWSVARAVFLTRLYNPVEDVLIYLLWSAFWCGLIAVVARFSGKTANA